MTQNRKAEGFSRPHALVSVIIRKLWRGVVQVVPFAAPKNENTRQSVLIFLYCNETQNRKAAGFSKPHALVSVTLRKLRRGVVQVVPFAAPNKRDIRKGISQSVEKVFSQWRADDIRPYKMA